jgi:transcriptional regulator with XRE-family HTH domain
LEVPTSFGRWVRQRRKLLDLTQDDLARAVGCSAVTIRKLESDERRPSRQIAERLADQLRVAPQERASFIAMARAEVDPAPAAAAGALQHTAQIAPPVPLTRLIGRKQDLAAVRSALLRGGTRLITLSGPPGIGKTRLALEAAGEVRGAFRDGVCFVGLAPVRDPELVLPAIAQALGLRERGGLPLAASAAAYLADKRLLRCSTTSSRWRRPRRRW